MEPRNATEEAPAAGIEPAVDAFARSDEGRRLAVRIESTAQVRARVAEPLSALTIAGLHRLRAGAERPALVVLVEDDEAAHDLADAVQWFLPEAAVGYLPHRGVDYGSGLDPVPHLVGERSHALEVLGAGGVVCVSADALVEKIPERAARPAPIRVAHGDVVERDQLIEALVGAGYERVAGHVEERGQVSVRGDVVDIFPTTGREPVRVELFGDDVERLSVFSALTQRSLRDLHEVAVYPTRERSDAPTADLYDHEEGPQVPRGLVSVVPELVSAGVLVALQPQQVATAVRERLAELTLPSAERGRGYLKEADALAVVQAAHALDSLPDGQELAIEGHRPALAVRGHAEAESALRGLVKQGLRVLVAFPHRGDAERALRTLTRIDASILPPDAALPDGAGISFVVARPRRGLIAPKLGIAVLPSSQLMRRRGPAAGEGTIGRAISSFLDLKVGDFVVHEDQGVARFDGFETKTVAGVTRDYLTLQFRGEDRIYLPHEQIAKISRYIGADARPPALSKLGGKAWESLKARARNAVHEMAGELLALYAARQAHAGVAAQPDGELLRGLEDSFPYVETEDQERAIEATKEDMELARPMDRLICGDVGFGKTEVAMRAAMKAVENAKQVLILVPTTILAQQHFTTFHDRFRDFPVRIELVSRFRKGSELKGAIADFREGKVEILIGTHRVLGRDIVPKDLGLVIVDEEQRFGVAQKELLRQMRTEVDVLALSATPIPRTLHMSLAGLRDISVIATPPRGRRPVKTHVGELDDKLIAQALTREVERGGQAFYLHNRVESIDEAAAKLRDLCPTLRFGVAHGQLTEHSLERVMEAFLRGDHDVLVATTIIESGIDIRTANTLIIERADLLGLSQLYQIRGRVGRSDVTAHAYLFYPDAETLSEEARARLSALADYTELGSGFKIAMRDLELRGAGNLLGDEQSGHVAAIGFELYCELLAEAVAELQGQATSVQRGPTARIDAHVDAFVPASYVGLEAVKMDVHRRIGLAQSEDVLRDLRVELADRFGPLPEAVENLLQLQEARLALQPLGAVALTVRKDRIALSGVTLAADELRALREECPAATYQSAKREVALRIGHDTPRMAGAMGLIAAILSVRSGVSAHA